MEDQELIAAYQEEYTRLVELGFEGWELEDALEDAAYRLMGV